MKLVWHKLPEYNRTLNVMGSLTVGNKDKVSFTVQQVDNVIIKQRVG